MRPGCFVAIFFCFVSSAMGLGITTHSEDLATIPFQHHEFHVPDPPVSSVLLRHDGWSIQAHYLGSSEDRATFAFSWLGGKVGKAVIDDLINPNGWIAFAPDDKSFALTWSDGGAIGNYHTRLFELAPTGRLVERSVAIQKVISDFQSHHDCRARGDNFLAVRWLSNTQLLLEASVYHTGDCGDDIGYTDRYVVNVKDGRIKRRIHVSDDLHP